MGFLDPRNPEIPNARTKSGEFLGPKLSTPTILPIRAKTGFGGEFFGPLFWLFLGFFNPRCSYNGYKLLLFYWEPRAHVSWIGLRQRPMIYHTLWSGNTLALCNMCWQEDIHPIYVSVPCGRLWPRMAKNGHPTLRSRLPRTARCP
jgi:hypothetical protein